jgi:excisionase family DNA binding protein
LETAHIQRKGDVASGDANGELLTRKEAAERLKISTSMLDILTKDGKLAVCRIGRRRLYRPSALADYAAQIEIKAWAA